MPIYEYACPHCHKTFEEWLRSAEEQTDIMPCPTCGQDAPRIISQTTFILKGGGWYVTEYGGQPKSDEGDGPEGNSADVSADAKADAKAGAAADASGNPTAGEKTGDKAPASRADTTAKKAESAPKASDSALPASAPTTPSPASVQGSGVAAPRTSAVAPTANA